MQAVGDSTSNRGSKRRRLNERAWRESFKRFDSSGLTVEAFCQREGLSRSSFNRWRLRLPILPGDAPTLRSQPDDAKITPSFVDLGLLGAAVPAATAGLELRLELGGGLSLTLVRR